MFGDEGLFGQIELSVDQKHRMIIPISTGREKGEKLILLYDEKIKIYKIYSIKRIEEEFKLLNKKIEESKTVKEVNVLKKRMYQLSKSIIKCSQVDVQGRIILNEDFPKNKKINCIGSFDHLILELKK